MSVFLNDTEDNEGEMFSSVKKDFHIWRQDERIFVCPVEIALFTKDTVEQLMKNPAKLVIPSVNYHAGHPILISASLVTSILGYQGEKGLRGAIQSLSRTCLKLSKMKDFSTCRQCEKQ